MENQTNSTPKWITIYLWIVTVMTLMFSLMGYFKPDVQLGTWEAFSSTGALSLAGPLGLYLARNLATALVGLYSLIKKSSAMIELFLVLRIVTDGMDFVHNMIEGNMPVAVFAIVMFLIEVFAFMQLRKASE